MKKQTLVLLIVGAAIVITVAHVVPIRQKTGQGTTGFQVSNSFRYSLIKGELSAYKDSTKCDQMQACDPNPKNIVTHRLYIW